MAAAERHKGQPRQVKPQHDQALQQLLGPPAGHKGCQQVQRVTQAVIAQRGNDIRTVTDGKIPGGHRRAGQHTARGLPQPAAIIDQKRVMLLEGIAILDKALPVQRKNSSPDAHQQGKQRRISQHQRPAALPAARCVDQDGVLHGILLRGGWCSTPVFMAVPHRSGCRPSGIMRCRLIFVQYILFCFALQGRFAAVTRCRQTGLPVPLPRTARPVLPAAPCWRGRLFRSAAHRG